MRPYSPSAFLTSLTLHGFLAAVLFVTTVYVARSDKLPPVIFELVAGPPTAPDELVAPALGNSPAPVKISVPKVVLPAEEPRPQESRAVPETKPRRDTSLAKDLKKSARVSYQEYLKKHPAPKPSATRPAPRVASVPKIDVQGITGGVRGGSTANTRGGGGGKAVSRELQDQLSTYISFLMQELKKAYEAPPGVSDQLSAKVTFDITASGAILSPRISKTSGNREFDEAVLDAFRRVRSIGPTPTHRPDTWTVTFQMKDEG